MDGLAAGVVDGRAVAEAADGRAAAAVDGREDGAVVVVADGAAAAAAAAAVRGQFDFPNFLPVTSFRFFFGFLP